MILCSRAYRLALLTVSLLAAPALRAADAALVDDFALPDQTARGAARLLLTDKDAGSRSHATQRCEDGVLVVEGTLTPGRGSPAFVSIPLLLAPDAQPQNVSTRTGVRLRVKVTRGLLSVQVASADVTNFDYHSAPVVGKRDGFVEVRVAFADLKRAWSEQTPLNTTALTSVNLVAFGVTPGVFAFEVDEIGFY